MKLQEAVQKKYLKRRALTAVSLLAIAVIAGAFFFGNKKLVTAEAVFNALVASDGAVSHWSFDEVSGTVDDLIGTKDGTIVGTPSTEQPAPLGLGYLFVGASSQGVELPNASFNSQTQGAIEFVIKPGAASVTGTHVIFAQYDSATANNLLNVAIENGKVRFNVRGNSATNTIRMNGATTLTAGQFYHIAVQNSTAGAPKIFVNGVEDTPYTFTNGTSTTAGWFSLSSASAVPAKYRIGLQTSSTTTLTAVVDEAAIYNAPKTATIWAHHYEEVFSHPEIVITKTPTKTFLKEGGDAVTYSVHLTYYGNGPASPVTVNITGDSPLLNVSPSTLTFTTGSETRTVTLSANDNGTVEGMRTTALHHTSSSSDARFNGATKAMSVDLTDAFTIWGLSDPHVNTDLTQGSYLSLDTAIKDSLGTTGSGHGFNWNLALVLGDVTGDTACPGPAQFAELKNQFISGGVNRNIFYTIPGNHDYGDNGDSAYLQKYLDPLGTHTATSNVNASLMPYPILPGGAFDHYAFEVGNVLFLMLGDRNDAAYPFGRTCGSSFVKDDGSHGINGAFDGAGHPAGTYTLATYNWWVNEIESNPDKIIITTAHHQLINTGARSGLTEGVTAPDAPHGNHGWADAAGSSIVYAMWNESANTYTTIDCYDLNHNPIAGCDNNADGLADVGFRQYLDAHPGAIDLWIYGHTHAGLDPDSTYNGRSLIEQVDGVTFVNLLAVSRFHGANIAAFSKTFDFLDGLAELPIKTYRHYNGWSGDVGFYAPAEEDITLSRAFSWPGVTFTNASPTTIFQEGAPSTYTIVLDTQPTAGQTVVITPHSSNAHVSASPATVTFTSANWDTPQTVTLSGVTDSTPISGSESATITHTISSGDTQYNALTGLAAFSITALPPEPTAPGAPSSLAVASVGDSQANLTWVAPADDGDSAITDYLVEYKRVADISWSTFADGTSTTAATTVTGLTNGTAYNFRVSAINAIGTGSPSATASGTPVTVPSAPAIGTATPGDGQVTLTFSASSTGGSPITGYTVTSTPGSITATGSSSPIIVTGLTNGTPYTFKVTATNAIGTSPQSSASNSATPVATPNDAPSSLVATRGNAQVALSWTAPVDNGGSPITDYLIEYKASSSGSWLTFSDGTSTATAATVTSLTNGTSYDFRVSAVNALGTGPASSTAVATPATVPSAPIIGTATPDDGQAAVTFTAPADNGSTIISYTATSAPGSITATGSGSPILITGLTNGTSYTFTVTATNAVGTSAASAASNAVVPSTFPDAPTNLQAAGDDGEVDLSWDAPTDDGGSPITDYDIEYKATSSGSWLAFADGTSTAITATVTGLTNGISYDFRVSAANVNGDSVPSGTATATPTSGITAPDAPTIGVATAGDGEATVTFSVPADDGGSAITSYTVTSSPGSIAASGSSSPITVMGLTNNTSYTFTVRATNSVGTSVSSSASNAVTPTGTPTPAVPPPPPSPTPPHPAPISGGYTTVPAEIPGYVPAPPPCSLGALYNSATGARCIAPTSIPSTTPPAVPSVAFVRNLSIGMTGLDVLALQRFLNTHGFILSLAGPGSPGNETTKFGALTRAALIRFQEAHAKDILAPVGLSKGTGFFGKATRNFINASPIL
jgi:hypothetical protein